MNLFKVTKLQRLHDFYTTKTKKLLYLVVGKQRNLRNCVTFDSTLMQKHPLGRIEFKQHDRKRIVNLQKVLKQIDLEEIKKVI